MQAPGQEADVVTVASGPPVGCGYCHFVPRRAFEGTSPFWWEIGRRFLAHVPFYSAPTAAGPAPTQPPSPRAPACWTRGLGQFFDEGPWVYLPNPGDSELTAEGRMG